MRIRPWFYYGLLMNTKNPTASIKGSWEKKTSILKYKRVTGKSYGRTPNPLIFGCGGSFAEIM